MESVQLRSRPFRFAFLVEPRDKKRLQDVFETNSTLWGGIFNFIVPLFKTVPKRYKKAYQKSVSAKVMLNGFVEAFQPDFVVETNPDQCKAFGIDFPEKRIIPLERIASTDERGRCNIGIDLRSVCHDLYIEQFRFVQRHGPEVLLPICKDARYSSLFAAMFGFLPETGDLARVRKVYQDALDAKTVEVDLVDFPKIFDRRNIFPLRLTEHKLETFSNSYNWHYYLFYMDETSGWDLIEYWNYRALGWPIQPIPARIASELKLFCEKTIGDFHRPFPPPSNVWFSTSLLRAGSQSEDDLIAYARTLKVAADNHPLSINTHVPRLWEEWGRSADHASPPTVEHTKQEAIAQAVGNRIHIEFKPHGFADDDPYCSRLLASANVIDSIGGDSAVIPWNRNVAQKLTYNFGEERTWISREGIVVFGGLDSIGNDLRMPTPLNIFRALAEASGFRLLQSPAGQVCEQIIASFGSLRATRSAIEFPELLQLLNSMAHEDLEVELEEKGDEPKKKKRVKKAYAFLNDVLRVLRLYPPNQSSSERLERHLSNLTRCNVLRVGMTLKCDACTNTSWFSLEDVRAVLSCPRCLKNFAFPSGRPPERPWAYRVFGPFATVNFASGAYCVVAAMHFIGDRVSRKTTMIPSFEMKKNGEAVFEADFGAFVSPGMANVISSPYLILGECKSFNRFQQRDFQRANEAAKLFPGAVLCFCTFNQSLEASEIKALKKIAAAGREVLDVGKSVNPVLILTARELFGQFRWHDLPDIYGPDEQLARMVFLRGDIREICEFTQRLYLGMPSTSDTLMEKMRKRDAKQQAAGS